VDIFEDPTAITVLADTPGVEPGELKIDLHDGVLTITGHAAVRERSNEVPVLHEYAAGTFQRSFTLSEAIDQEQTMRPISSGRPRSSSSSTSSTAKALGLAIPQSLRLRADQVIQ
jgi:HSP20 family protein